MRLASSPRWVAGGATLAVWALAAGSALFWGLRGGGGLPADARVAGGPDAGEVKVDSRSVARALGAPEAGQANAAPAPDVVKRLALRGIVTHGGRGAALISVDGKAPKPVRVGAALEGVDGWAVRSVSPRAVVLAAGEREATLDMPALNQRSSARDAVAPPSVAPALPPQQPLQVAPQPPSAVGSGAGMVAPAQGVGTRIPKAYPASRTSGIRG